MGKLGKIKGKLRLYIKWPLYLTLLLLVAGLGVYLISPQAGLLMVIVIIIYAAIAGGLYIYNKPSIYTDMVSFDPVWTDPEESAEGAGDSYVLLRRMDGSCEQPGVQQDYRKDREI